MAKELRILKMCYSGSRDRYFFERNRHYQTGIRYCFCYFGCRFGIHLILIIEPFVHFD